jgi:hypothetical protein
MVEAIGLQDQRTAMADHITALETQLAQARMQLRALDQAISADRASAVMHEFRKTKGWVP